MVYTKPCCERLQEVMVDKLEQHMLHMIGEGDSKLLLLTTGCHRAEIEGKYATAWVDVPILFCPFCGSRLQTQADIDKWQEANSVTDGDVIDTAQPQ